MQYDPGIDEAQAAEEARQWVPAAASGNRGILAARARICVVRSACVLSHELSL